MSVSGPGRVIDNGLVLYLDASNNKSYVSGSNTWFDVSRNGNNGTLTNGPTFNSANGGSIVFDGTNDYVNLTSASLLPVGTSNRTIVAFVRTPTSFSEPYLHVIHWGTAVTDQSFGLAIFNNGGLNTHPWNGAPSQGTVLTGTNYCLAVSYTHSGTLHKFWINGVSQGAGVSRSINTGTSEARVGARISTPIEDWGPNGQIYNILVYNRSLSDAEILQIYNLEKKRFGL
jgi:hypothetical protein